MADLSNITVVIPSLDPDDRLPGVIRGVREKGFTDILLVDDGSAAENQHYFEDAAKEAGCTVLHHPQNRGKGRALKTAFEWLIANRPEGAGCVTIDGDGQHLAEDILACTEVMLAQKNDALVLGVRDFNAENVPPKSRYGNKCTSFVFRAFCGLKVSDTQTGLRVFPRGIWQQMLEISGERFEYETNMLLMCKQLGLPIVEQTIQTVYIDANATTHFHPVRDSVRIYGMILKFFMSSLLSFIIDIGLFALFKGLLLGKPAALGAHSTFLAAVGARILSSVFNFTVNRKAVFRSDAPLRTTLLRYYVLWGCQLLTSVLLTRLLSAPFGEDHVGIVTVIKAIVDGCLYFISFRVQQAWVFRKAPQDKKG